MPTAKAFYRSAFADCHLIIATIKGNVKMSEKESYALGYFFGRAFGSYMYLDLDNFSDRELYEFKQGYDRGVLDYCEE